MTVRVISNPSRILFCTYLLFHNSNPPISIILLCHQCNSHFCSTLPVSESFLYDCESDIKLKKKKTFTLILFVCNFLFYTFQSSHFNHSVTTPSCPFILFNTHICTLSPFPTLIPPHPLLSEPHCLFFFNLVKLNIKAQICCISFWFFFTFMLSFSRFFRFCGLHSIGVLKL